MKYLSSFFLILGVCSFFFLFIGTAEGQEGIVKCGIKDADGKELDPCGFSDLGDLILGVTQSIIYQFAPLLVILMIAAGGFTILVARESPEMYRKGIQIIQYALIGYVIVLLSFLIVEVFLIEIMGVNSNYGMQDWENIGGIFGSSQDTTQNTPQDTS